MMFRTQISAAIVLVGLLAGPPSLHAGSGRQKSFPGPGTDVETVGQVVVYQPAGTELIILRIANPSNQSQAYPDAIIDVFSYPAGNFIAEGRAGCAFDVGCYNADVVLQPQSSSRMLTVIVRGTPGSPPQTQVPLKQTRWNGSSPTYSDLGSFDIAAGPRIVPSGGLMAQTHVTTVEERGGTNNSVLMVLVDDVPIAFDDNSGPALMSFLCTPLSCPDGRCTILPARRSNGLPHMPLSDPARFDVPKPGPVTVVWDEGAHNHRADQDNDGLGDDLEVFLGTCDPNHPGKDTDGDGKPDCTDQDVDGDGIPDAYEVLGKSDDPNYQDTTFNLTKFPYYGADPLKKDLFVEMVWAPKCKMSQDPGCTPGNLNPDKNPDTWEWTPDIALAYAKKFPPDLAVHVDIGPKADDPVSPCADTTCGNWGAQRLADNVDYSTPTSNYNDLVFCNGFWNGGQSPDSPRLGYFYHAIIASEDIITFHMCSKVDNRPGGAAHETGHFLGLRHWGEWSGNTSGKVNCKPNYVSVMNYAYQDDGRLGQGAAFPGFSVGRFLSGATGHGDVVLNPTAIDEAAGLWPFGNFDRVNDASVLDLVNTVFHRTVDLSSGGIDWDMDGKVRPSGAQVKAFINRNNGDCDPSPPAGDSASLIAFLPGAPVGLNPSVASSLSGSGLALFITGNCSPGFFCTTALLRTVSPCTDSGDNPCRYWQEWQSLGQTVDGVNSMTAAGNIVVYEDQVGHLLHYVGQSPAGAAVGGKVGGPAVAGPPTAVVAPAGSLVPGGVQVYAAVTVTSGGTSSTTLRKWAYDPANDSWFITGAIERWPNGDPVEMVPGTAIGAALGYRSDVTDAGGVPVQRLFAAIPSKNSSTGAAELALAVAQEQVLTVPLLGFSVSLPLPYSVWTPLPDQIWAWRSGGKKPTADIGRVGLAFRPEDPVVSGAPHAGRFYVTWQTKDGSQARVHMSFTRGNVLPLSGTAPTSTVQGLVFVGDSDFYNSGTNWPKGVGLVYAGGHVRGVGADEAFISRYFPHVDGIFQSQQHDHDDYTHIMSKLPCALTQCGSLHQ